MGTINVQIFEHERVAMAQAINKKKGETIAVSALAKIAGLNPNRARFVLDELVQDGTVKKTATKTYNPKYVRYCYEVVK